MKRSLSCLLLFGTVLALAAAPAPALAFDGYVEHAGRRDYRIEISVHPSGLISGVITYAGEPFAKTEEMSISETGRGFIATDRFQKNQRTVTMERTETSIRLQIINENTDTHVKSLQTKIIKVHPRPDALFEDEDHAVLLSADGTFRVEPIRAGDDPLIIRGNKIFLDGWYRSDWKRDGAKTEIKEFTTMEIPGDWIADGGGVFTGRSLFTPDVAINVMNYYIMDIYLRRPIFIPFVFGLETGAR